MNAKQSKIFKEVSRSLPAVLLPTSVPAVQLSSPITPESTLSTICSRYPKNPSRTTSCPPAPAPEEYKLLYPKTCQKKAEGGTQIEQGRLCEILARAQHHGLPSTPGLPWGGSPTQTSFHLQTWTGEGSKGGPGGGGPGQDPDLNDHLLLPPRCRRRGCSPAGPLRAVGTVTATTGARHSSHIILL